jgi:hypothetical protein
MSEQAQALPRGYRSKPIWIRLLAAALILAPIGNIAFTLYSLELPWSGAEAWRYWIQFIKPQVWALNVLLLMSGLALIRVRTWTHMLASVTLVLVLIYNIATWEKLLFLGPATFGLMVLASLIAAAVLYSREFRKPYFNPRLRWWETSPRYQARLSVRITHASEGDTHPAEILDVSRSGLFVAIESNPELPIGEEHHIILPTGIELRAQIVRRTATGYGFRFVRVGWVQRAQIKKFVRQLSTDPSLLLR